ncbi:Cell wall-associated hydrolase, NlpC family [Lentibacillus persicus]|uniref:Cell wall-associated hydrolase, NlpC family n=1 Tax=Lentibacillus persicus TaxID=640948 RepID=A0A1I1X804_9BACI|nr:NlpC/P60 family protein [Lentibacillus persicus]SFE03477.1 Cell wall-associated hydrolase, NlpC family [Lentibacillus persicus]
MLEKYRSVLKYALIVVLVASTFAPVTTNAHPKGKDTDSKTDFIDVAVATLWSEPDMNRTIDRPSTTNPVDMWEWTTRMSLDQKLWLVGNLQTQALYGQKVTILEEQGEWVKVAVHGQPTPKNEIGYPAWMPKTQLANNKRFEHVNHHSFALVTEPTTWLYGNASLEKEFKEISFNTRLPVINQKTDAILVATPSDGNKWISAEDVSIYDSESDIPEPTGDDLVKSAKKFLGLPYLWAGASGFGFDCSGFTHTIYKANGITIPRDSSVQATHGTPVERENLEKGDLLFFAYNEGEGSVHHVAMYIGNGKMIHSPNSSSTVEIIELADSAYEIEYAGARRYID